MLVLFCSIPGGEVNWLIIKVLIMPQPVVQFLSIYQLMELECNTCFSCSVPRGGVRRSRDEARESGTGRMKTTEFFRMNGLAISELNIPQNKMIND